MPKKKPVKPFRRSKPKAEEANKQALRQGAKAKRQRLSPAQRVARIQARLLKAKQDELELKRRELEKGLPVETTG